MNVKKILLLVLLLCIAVNAYADTLDDTLYVSSSMLLAIDAEQTLEFLSTPPVLQYKQIGNQQVLYRSTRNIETNWLLGSNPSQAQVIGYGVSWIVLDGLVWYFAPETFKKIWLSGVLSIEVASVSANAGWWVNFKVMF